MNRVTTMAEKTKRKLVRVHRDRPLTEAEKASDREIRRKVMEEIPPKKRTASAADDGGGTA